MVFRVLSVAVMAAGLLGFAGEALAKPHKISRQIPVDEEFVELKVAWTGTAPSYTYRVRIIQVDGILEFCGAGVYTNAQLRSQTNTLLKNYSLEMNGKPILADFGFFTKVRSVRKLDSAKANCVSTGAPVPRKKPEFSFGSSGRQRFRVN